MKIAISRASLRFWALYLLLHFCFLLMILFIFRWVWAEIVGKHYVMDPAEMAFESACYAVLITLIRFIRYYIGKKRYEKNPVDRRKNNLFRE
ncbi:MAG: hypothetical protein II723_00520 [Oscillospiraceae bacterium]|nr:hypothetical protein [Oscillospiraceae bacterium]